MIGVIPFILLTLGLLAALFFVLFSKKLSQFIFGFLGVSLVMAGYFMLLSHLWLSAIQVLMALAVCLILYLFIHLVSPQLKEEGSNLIAHERYALVLGGLFIVFMASALMQWPHIFEPLIKPEHDLSKLSQNLIQEYLIPIEIFITTLVITIMGAMTIIRREAS
jgi:NADH:ubiquinone oxidoreductase subunit 6 (subunit J)